MSIIRPINIMVVDDECKVYRIIEDAINETFHTSYSTLPVCNGNQAILALQYFIPKLLITDIYLPNIDGKDLTKHIKEHHPETFVIAISAEGESILKEMSELGANVVLNKEDLYEELVMAITLFLERLPLPDEAL